MNDNYKLGWIGLYRSIKNHWIYPTNRIFTKYEAWIDLILSVNYSDKKVFFNEDIILCKQGEIITSQKKLMEKWKWSKSKLIKFLKVLKKESMIEYFSDSKKTTIKVLNYINYQDFEQVEKNKKDRKKTVESPQKDFKKTVESFQKDTNNKNNKVNKKNKVNKVIKEMIPPTLNEVKIFFKENDYPETLAIKAYNYYSIANWFDSRGHKIKNWKQKMISVWFKEENKIKETFEINDIWKNR
jgi:hypothetical protein